MTFEELLKKSRKEGRTEGMADGIIVGQDRILKLISCMSANGETDRIPELERSKDFLEEMYKKYNL